MQQIYISIKDLLTCTRLFRNFSTNTESVNILHSSQISDVNIFTPKSSNKSSFAEKEETVGGFIISSDFPLDVKIYHSISIDLYNWRNHFVVDSANAAFCFL